MQIAVGPLLDSRQRRIKRLQVSPELLLELLKVPVEGAVVDGRRIQACHDGIPESAVALRCGITDLGDVQMLIEDQSFDQIIEGTEIPILSPHYSQEEVQ